ncbi:hypothetical protein BG006_008478 [Podila minutissima]|uniref:Nucleotide-sugar transporter n=1 Tax=Podila minutissima TaxID=64525 RepID=A0A9P5VJK3_9FUNG|nr:hypothetical protein BG006_008478 [Podila minutissima]
MLLALWTRVRSMGLTFLLGFLLCIFQSSESILVKLAGNRPEPHPASAKLLFLSELLKLLISYTLLSVERKELVGLARIFRRRCYGCKCSGSSSISTNEIKGHAFVPLQDEEEQHGKRLLNNNDEAEEDEDDDATLHRPQQPSTAACSFPPILLFAVPGAIYFFNNNLTFILLSLMPAPTYVVLSNLKILTTGLFSYWFLHRMLTKPQWISLGILFFSTAISQVDLEQGLSLSISPQAFLLMILFCSLSAAASVFSEYVMKERFANESIHLQNMKLYMFGILFNGITYLLTPAAPTESGPAGFWSDMAPIHFFVILAYASLGLVTSAIIKFSGSITKVYASSMSMFFAALVSWLFLSDQLTVLFFVGCFGCCYALHLYYRAPPPSPDAGMLPTAMALTERDSTSSNASSSSGSSPTTLSSVKVDRSDYLSLDPLGDDEGEQDSSHKRQSGDSRR